MANIQRNHGDDLLAITPESHNTWTVNVRPAHRAGRRELSRAELSDAIIRRFNRKIYKTDSCWLWSGAKETHGYGLAYTGLKPDGRKDRHYAHRIAYVIAHGCVPAHLEVMHSCDVPRCVNPAHLSLGTHQQNITDREARGRGKKESPKIRKITVEGVVDIRRSTDSDKVLAARYGVHFGHIRNIRAGKKRKVA